MNLIQQIPRLPPVLGSRLSSTCSIRPNDRKCAWRASPLVVEGKSVTKIAHGGMGGAGPIEFLSH